jgi:amino acid transporter
LFEIPKSLPALFESPLCTATAIAGWAFLGFESAGSIGEEVRDPSRAIPRAMLLSLVSVASVVAFTALAMILSMPDMDAVVAGHVADPVAATLGAYFGRVGMKFVLAVFMVGFIAGIVSMQASVSRVIWAFARDGELPGSGWIQVLSRTDRLPVNAIYVATAMSLVLFILSFTSVYTTVVAFTAGGFYLAFAFPILAAAWTRLVGRWERTPFDLGFATGPVLYGAAAWIVFQTINIAWPRDVAAPWYERWGVLVMVVLLGVIGVLVRMSVDRDEGERTA